MCSLAINPMCSTQLNGTLAISNKKGPTSILIVWTDLNLGYNTCEPNTCL